MKTILYFDGGIEERGVILRHDKRIRIYREVRRDHIESFNLDGEPIEFTTYVVIHVPMELGIDPTRIQLSYCERIATGFLINESDDAYEILLYDRFYFCGIVYGLRDIGLFRVTQLSLPNRDDGEFLPYYINATGWRWCYNLFAFILQTPFVAWRRVRKRRVRKTPS